MVVIVFLTVRVLVTIMHRTAMHNASYSDSAQHNYKTMQKKKKTQELTLYARNTLCAVVGSVSIAAFAFKLVVATTTAYPMGMEKMTNQDLVKAIM